jgi:hypothetical protein
MNLSNSLRWSFALAIFLSIHSSGECQTPPATGELSTEDLEIFGPPGAIGGPRVERPSQATPIVPKRWLVVPKSSAADGWKIVVAHVFDRSRDPQPADKTEDPLAWRVALDPHLAHSACAYTSIECDDDEVRMARLDGAEALFVNGEAFAGDRERYGFMGVPVALRKGKNDLFVVGCKDDGFSLELTIPKARLVIGTWDIRWPYCNAEAELQVPVFNASLETSTNVHVHYGHAYVERPGCKPRVTDWRDGGHIAPLGIFLAASYFEGLTGDDGDAGSPWEGIVLPLCIYDGRDADADRELLHHPKGAPADGGANKSWSQRSANWMKDTLRGRVGAAAVFVYGTHGAPEENAAMLARARFDQEMIWYRSGVVHFLISDEQYLEARTANPQHSDVAWRIDDKDFVLYGNEDSNGAWKALVPADGAVHARNGAVAMSGRSLEGDDIAGWCVYKRVERPRATIAAVIGTGLRGMLAGYSLRPMSEPIGTGEFALYRASEKGAAVEELARGPH